MAHEIEAMAYAGQVPWHGLGANVSPDLTPAEFLKAAGLDWTVSQEQAFFELDGEKVEIPHTKALVRSNDRKVLSVINEWWKPVQNADLIGIMDAYVTAGGAKMETAGSLRGGKIIWALANLGHDFEARPGDKVKGYLLMTGSHEPGRATAARTTQVRVVCRNTLAMAENAGGNLHYSQNHLADFNFDRAKEEIGKAHEQLAEAERVAKKLADFRISTTTAVREVLVPVYYPELIEDSAALAKIMDKANMPRMVSGLLESLHNAPGADPGTGWGVLNAVTHYTDHVGGRAADTRLASAWLGEGARKKLAVQSKLLELAA